MDISPKEAEEALAAIQLVVQKTRRSISGGGGYLFLIIWGVIWLLGFTGSQFLSQQSSGYLWMALDVIGAALSLLVGVRINRGVRRTSALTTGKRIGLFWLLLFAYVIAAMAVSWPLDGKQAAMYIILFVMVGWLAMGLLLSFAPIWPGLLLTALALIGYFLLPDFFYLWMAILGGGGMIAFGLYVRSRW